MSKVGRKIYLRNPSIRRFSSLPNDVTLLWLTSRAATSKQAVDKVFNRQIVDNYTLICYTKLAKAIRYVNRAKPYEYLIVIITELDLRFAKPIVDQLQQRQQIRVIIVLADEKDKIDFVRPTMDTSNKTVICETPESVTVQLEQSLQKAVEYSENEDIFTTYNPNEKALQDVRHELGAFVWTYSNLCKYSCRQDVLKIICQEK